MKPSQTTTPAVPTALSPHTTLTAESTSPQYLVKERGHFFATSPPTHRPRGCAHHSIQMSLSVKPYTAPCKDLAMNQRKKHKPQKNTLSSTFFTFQRAELTEWKDKLHPGRKYLQIMYLIKDLHSEYRNLETKYGQSPTYNFSALRWCEGDRHSVEIVLCILLFPGANDALHCSWADGWPPAATKSRE